MTTLDVLLLQCVARGGPVLNITPGKPPWICVQGRVRELNATPVTPEDAQEMIYAMLSDAEKVQLEQEEHLKFDYEIKDVKGGPLTFRVYVYLSKGMLFATFRNSEPPPPAAQEPPTDPLPGWWGDFWRRGAGGSPRDRGGGAPVPAPVGPAVPVRWGRDAKPIPREGESDDNPAAQ